MGKYIQVNESLYCNNEYSNMPSCGMRYGERLTTKTIKGLDMCLVKDICAKYGFGVRLITDTFGAYGERGVYATEIIIFKRLDISELEICELRRLGMYKTIFDLCPMDIRQRMHDCIHELDECTALYFETGWMGNCGAFGSDDVRRKCYYYDCGATTYSQISDRYPTNICDTNKSFHRGEVYMVANARYLKPME